MLLQVQRSDFKRIGREIGQADLGIGELILRSDTDTAAAATKVENAVYPVAIHPGLEMVGNQFSNR